MRALFGLAAALTIAACGPAASKPTTEPRPRLATAAEARAPATRRATLHWENKNRPSPLPLVTGTIAGHPVTMLVDTGANSHVIAGWMARKLGLPMKKLGDVGTDHVGKAIVTYRVEKADMTLDEWGPLAESAVLATEVPEVIEKLGIGAFISPQRLVEDGDAVILDLAGSQIRAAWWDEAHYELASSGAPLVLGDEGRACEDVDGPIHGLAFVVPATVEGNRAELLLDTGATHSDLFAASKAGVKLAPLSVANGEAMYTASGKISARRLKGVKVGAGSYAVTSDVDLIAGAGDASCPRDGALAMDYLRSCTLLLGRTRVYGRCADAKK